jgi:integrase/transcriptional regulator with XRE-family HTH domain
MTYNQIRYTFVFEKNEGEQYPNEGFEAKNAISWQCISPLALQGMTIPSKKIMPISFAKLIDDYERRIATESNTTADSSKPYSYAARNRVSMLRTTLRLLNISAETPVEGIISVSALEPTLAALNQVHGIKPQRKADLRSNLRWWSTFFMSDAQEYVAERQIVDTKQAKLGFILRRSIRAAGISQREVAAKSEIPLVTLEKWCRGASLPDYRSLDKLRRLETVLGLPQMSLNASLRKRIYGKSEKIETRYSQELRQKRETRYRFSPNEITSNFKISWEALVAHQASMSPTLKRSHLAQWTYKPVFPGAKKPAWFESYRGHRCAYASVAWNNITGFLAFLSLPIEIGGMGVSRTQAQSLAWLAEPRAIEAYVVWHKSRAGTTNNGLRNFAGYVAAMCRRETGYLRQQPEFANELPHETAADWNEMCDRAMNIANKVSQSAKTRSRDPFEGLEYYFSFEDPAEPILNAIRNLQHGAAVLPKGSPEQSIALRDAAILALLLLSPLRIGTVKNLRINDRKEVKLKDGRLILNIPEILIKNGPHRGDLRMEMQSDLVQCIDTYLKEARPLLKKGTDTELLFFSSRKPMRPWDTMSVRITELTVRYCDGHSIPLHSLRHLVATRHLRRNPGDYLGAADLLHDSVEMVMKTYIKRNDGTLKRHGESYKL